MVLNKEDIKKAICDAIDETFDNSMSLDISISLRIDKLPIMRIRNKKYILPYNSSMVSRETNNEKRIEE